MANILWSGGVRAPHLLLPLSLHPKAAVWSLSEDKARCSVLTKPSSGLVTRKRRRKSAPSSCPNEAPDQGSSEVESGVELMSSRKYSTIIIMPWEAGPGIILEEKKEKAFVVFWERGGSETEKEKSSREVGALNSDRKFQQKKLACLLTTQLRANSYTQMLMCMHTHSQTHRHWFVLQLTPSKLDVQSLEKRRKHQTRRSKCGAWG